MSKAQDKVGAMWLLAAARKAAEDENYEAALSLVGDAAQRLGELIVANGRRKVSRAK